MTENPRVKREKGFTLIEALVALFVAAVGILGILGMQMRTLADTESGVRRAQAIRLIEDLEERLRTLPNAYYVLTNPGQGLSAGPVANVISDWQQNAQSLPGGQVSVFEAADRQLGVLVAWRQNERSENPDYLEPLDQLLTEGGTGSNPANACPDGYICHLQYIPVASRCTISKDFPGRFFCAG